MTDKDEQDAAGGAALRRALLENRERYIDAAVERDVQVRDGAFDDGDIETWGHEARAQWDEDNPLLAALIEQGRA